MSHQETGARLRAARRLKGLSVAEAGESFGVSRSTVTRWEAGKYLPTTATLTDYLARIGAPAAELPVGRDKGPKLSLRLLRAKRRRAGVTIQEMSHLTGLSLASLHRYEMGEREPDAGTVALLLQAYGCPAEERDALSKSASGGPVIERFLSANGAAQAAVYRRLEELDRSPALRSGETIEELVHGFMIMGDHHGLLEAWDLMKDWSATSEMNEEPRATISLSLALARLTCHADRANAAMKVGKWRDLGNRLAPTALSHLIRLSQSLGRVDEAGEWLERLIRHAVANSAADVMFICDLNRITLNFYVSRSPGLISAIDRLREGIVGPAQRYTLDVAETWMHAEMGQQAEARRCEIDCRAAEVVYGLGSPLLTRLRRKFA